MNNLFHRFFRHFYDENYEKEIELLLEVYCWNPFAERPQPLIISSIDGSNTTVGLADRLKGIVSIYAFCKATNQSFRIKHQVPFRFEEYFEPNEYDWILKKGEISYNLYYSKPIVLLDWTKISGEKLLNLPIGKQYHIFSNKDCLDLINIKYNADFKFPTLFNELFKPSKKIQEGINALDWSTDAKYISVSFRFLQLMGDLKDDGGEVLLEKERSNLINKCHTILDKVYRKSKDIDFVLVTSDSQNFIKSLENLSYVKTIPGKIGHIGYSMGDDVMLKTFLDFYMISKAQKVYMAHTGLMYRSNFARTAAMTTGTEYEEISF